MEKDQQFRLSLDFEGKHYEGEVTPSEEKGQNGMPVYFRVVLGGEFFAYLCCGDYGWRERDGEEYPQALVDAIGSYIIRHYE
jgi:hypothetical protein